MTAFRVELRGWEEARTVAGPIRHAIFFGEKDAPPGVEIDDMDAQSVHAIAYDDAGNAVGTGRLLPDGQLGRLAVVKDWRCRGVGAAILDALMEEARRLGYAAVTLSASLQAAEFYRGLGFAAEGKVFKEGSILQQKMRKPLA